MGPSARAGARARARFLASAFVVSLLATLLTPSGPGLYTHLLGALAQPGVVNNTAEYLSPDFHGSTARIFLVLLLLVIVILAAVPRRPSWPRLFLVLANIALALMARRNIPLFAITVLPLLALEYDGEWRRLPEFGMRRVFRRDEAGRRSGIWSLVAAGCMVILALAHGRIGPWTVIPDGFDRRDFPVEAVSEARAAGLEGRVFNEFLWGGYLIYAWPEQKVFIDGGSYNDRMISAYAQILFRTPGWRDALRRWDISLVLVPAGSSLAAELSGEPGWKIWHRDAVATLLRREGPAPAQH
jgi:membrane protease YdiL (CAAX protease family)